MRGHRAIVIAANTDVGVLYGAFAFLSGLQTHQPIDSLAVCRVPAPPLPACSITGTISNGTVERGYAGFSLWDWQTLPDYADPRYTDYARANASLGINGSVLTNVNANATSLTAE